MSTATYTIPTQPTTFGHSPAALAWLGDYQEREYTQADAMAASGDYFITLATRLDKIAQGLPLDSAEQIELEHIVKTLFYLQDNYDIKYKFKQR